MSASRSLARVQAAREGQTRKGERAKSVATEIATELGSTGWYKAGRRTLRDRKNYALPVTSWYQPL